eukprot:4309919-Lingulodinium_polyedra.AAC.1
MPLLGAVAYLAHARPGIVVCICALQRYTHKPQIQHVRKLNQLLKCTQNNPRKLMYNCLPSVG